MKRILATIISFTFPAIVFAQNTQYTLLEGGFLGQDTIDVTNIGGYLGALYQVFFTITVVISVVMVIWGGIEWMFSAIPGVKMEGKQRIFSALTGLLIALSSWLILYTINPDLLDFNLLIN